MRMISLEKNLSMELYLSIEYQMMEYHQHILAGKKSKNTYYDLLKSYLNF